MQETKLAIRLPRWHKHKISLRERFFNAIHHG